ncbi:MAG: threonylcarbamoyl-AMP synthase [Phycisphaeraceae bacterium]|nr:threonylcarbamoyl-AMP synthase [Phycisphaeraceae bacterium]
MSNESIILKSDDRLSIDQAAKLLRDGELVGMPTETVYGLAADALNEAAVAKVFEAKERPSFDPLIVHVPDTDRADKLAHFNKQAQCLAEAFWPGPMTLVLPRKSDEQGRPIVPDLVTAGLGSVGIRVPDHPVALALLQASNCPLAAPSANKFGSISPTLAQHVVDELDRKVSVVLDGGPCGRGVESTVVRVTGGGAEVLRLGALPVELVEEVVGGLVKVCAPSSSPGAQAKPSPGMVDRHYAPGTPMRLFDSLDALKSFEPAGRWALLCVGPEPEAAERFEVMRNLSESGDLAFAAARLFSTLRELDGMALDGIAALSVAREGLGRAINDRLSRGSM